MSNLPISSHWADNIATVEVVESETNKFDVELDEIDIEYFTKLCHSIIYQGLQISIYGRVKTIVYNPYTTILNEYPNHSPKRKKWEKFVTTYFKTPERFNHYCETDKYAEIFTESNYLTFKNEPLFNLIFSSNPITNSIDVFIKESPHNKQVRLLCDLNNINAKKIIYHYLKLTLRLKCLIEINSEKKVYDAILKEVAQGYFSENINPIPLSNRTDVWCYAYIPLNYTSTGPTPAWNAFMNQFKDDDARDEFRKWIYGIFVQNDYDRRVLWIEGDSETGKTTVLNVIEDYLKTFGNFLVGSIATQHNQNQFSLAGMDKVRYAIYADAKDPTFFSRRDIMNLTGSDTVRFEQKFKDAETKRLYVRIAVSSNFSPNINTKNTFETSRLLHIKLDSQKSAMIKKSRTMTENAYKKALFNEMPAFLANARILYGKKS